MVDLLRDHEELREYCQTIGSGNEHIVIKDLYHRVDGITGYVEAFSDVVVNESNKLYDDVELSEDVNDQLAFARTQAHDAACMWVDADVQLRKYL